MRKSLRLVTANPIKLSEWHHVSGVPKQKDTDCQLASKFTEHMWSGKLPSMEKHATAGYCCESLLCMLG